jgi:hypothetical protein
MHLQTLLVFLLTLMSWQLVTAVRDEGDGLSLVSDSHEVMTALIVVLP